MKDWLDDSRNRRDGVTIPTIWIAVVLSLLFHVAVLWKWLPRIHMPSPEQSELGESNGSLVVRLAPLPRPPSAPLPSPALQAQPAPAPQPRSRPAARQPPAKPVIALKTSPAASKSTPVPAPTTTAPPPRPPGDGDLASYIEARRRARGDSAAPPAPTTTGDAPAAEDDNTRSNRIAAANLATRRKTFGYDPSHGGGVFEIVSIGYLNAEFMFFGWNKDIRRNTKQLIEVQKGNNADTRIAVVRRMIAIIREYEQGDFQWDSQRLGRSVMLSARARDNAGLEDFMMHEFFDDPRRPW